MPEKIALPAWVEVNGRRYIVFACREDGFFEPPCWVLCYFVGETKFYVTKWHIMHIDPAIPHEAFNQEGVFTRWM